MKQVKIIRLEANPEHGTFGVLLINSEVFCFTLEPPDRENAQNISSIPAGQYYCEPYSSEKYPRVYQVMNVPGRGNILFHKGNIIKHTQGCIILGASIGKLKDDRAVLNSGDTFERLVKYIGNNTFHLTIVEHYG